MKPRLLTAAALAAGLAANAAGAASAPDWVVRARATSVDPDLLVRRPAPDAVVLWRQQIVTAGSVTGSTKLFRREAVKILNPEGRSAGTFEAFYDDDSKVSIEGAWTLHADGSTEKLDLDQVVSIQLAHPEYFTDDFQVVFRPPRLAPKDIAAFALSRKSHRDVYQWQIALQDSLPIAAQEVAFDLPEGWRHHWRLTARPEGYTGAVSGEGGAKASYLFAGQHALPSERAAPPWRDRAARMEVVILPPAGKFPELVFENWNQVGAWFYRKSLPARTDPPPETLPEPPGAAVKASRWVQDKIRYVAVEAGEGGYVPREPALVVRRRYGDCKDKAFLLIAILAKRGIEALPILTRPLDEGSIDADFPSPIQFDHVIVAVRLSEPGGSPAEVRLADGPALLFDPTDPWTPWGQLPAALQGASGLLVRRAGAELLAFPVAPASFNRLQRNLEAELDAEGSLSARVTERTEGALCERGFYQRRTSDERSEAISRFASEHIQGARASGLELSQLDNVTSPLDARFSVRAPGFLRKTGTLLLLPALPFSVGPARIPHLEDRRLPIDLWLPRIQALTATVRLPPGLRVDGLPDPIDIDTPYLRYHAVFSVKDGAFVAGETYEVKKRRIPTEDLSVWKSVEAAVARAAATKVILAH